MGTKTLVMVGMTIGSVLGGYLPVVFGADALGIWSILGSAIGGFAGIWLGWKAANF